MPVVTSSFINRVEHYPREGGSGILVIEFKNGSVRAYYNVSREIYDEFLDAPSKGSYYTSQIKGEYKSGRGYFQDASHAGTQGNRAKSNKNSKSHHSSLDQFLKR
jgi:hypothetical protein